MNQESMVKNAADSQQVNKAKRKIGNSRKDELKDIRAILKTHEGKRFVWRMLEKCKTFSSVWESSAKIHYNAGQQDIGHFLMAEIVNADENLLFEMMKENTKNNGENK